ncbi:Nif3-like dinuclear metal center hexameric protein [Eubacteriaceae bacterium ES3]|nr:Nif3-like dinuclear metal center hexameric protein [Eubacteriaceae bacterium ES3]
MAVRLEQIIKGIETVAPRYLQESWDNVGLMLGERSQMIEKIILTLDVTEAVIEEAIEEQVDLIISHHPFIFSGLKTLSCDTLKGRMIRRLIQNNISVYSAHTNLDLARFGLNDFVGNKLGLKSMKPLENFVENYVKLAVFVPATHEKEILNALGKTGAGAIGNYDSCSFSCSGTGRFRPLTGADPFIGTVNEFEAVKELRIEAIVHERSLEKTINQVKKMHPYETMAYDVYPLKTKMEAIHGLGRIGELQDSCNSDIWIEQLKKALNIKILREAGKRPARIKKVALCTGAGADLLSIAKALKADVFVTGDLKYHDGQRAEELGIWVLDAGHFETEKFAPDCLEKILNEQLSVDCPAIIKANSMEGFLKFI